MSYQFVPEPSSSGNPKPRGTASNRTRTFRTDSIPEVSLGALAIVSARRSTLYRLAAVIGACRGRRDSKSPITARGHPEMFGDESHIEHIRE